MADTAALVVALSAQLTKFEKDMKDAVTIADTNTKKIESTFSKMNSNIDAEFSKLARSGAGQLGPLGGVLTSLGPVGLTAAAGIGAIAGAFAFVSDKVDQFIEKSKALKEAAEAAGISVDQFKALAEAGKQVGLDFEQTERFILRLTLAIGDLRTKGQGPLFDALLKINPQLISQIAAAKDVTEAIDILSTAYKGLNDQIQKNQLVGSIDRRNVAAGGALLGAIPQGGVEQLTTNLQNLGKGAPDPAFTKRMIDLSNQIKDIKSRTDNLWGQAFSPDVLAAEKASAEYWERISKALIDAYQQAKAGNIFTRGDLTPPGGGDQTASFAERFGNLKPASDAVSEALTAGAEILDRHSNSLASDLARMNLYITALGGAATQADLFRQKQLQLAVEADKNKDVTGAAAKGLADFSLQQQQATEATRERLGVATQDQIIQARLAKLYDDAAKQGLTANEVLTATTVIMREAKTAADALEVRRAYLPGLKQLELDAQNVRKGLDTLSTQSLNTLADGFADVIVGTKSLADAFKSMTESILRDLVRLALRQTVIGPIAGALQGVFPGAGPGITTGPNPTAPFFGRQSGGPVSAGHPYFVGEHGMELFVPSSSGQIVPGQLSKGGGGGSEVIINNYTAADSETKQSKSEGPNGERIVIDIIKKAQSRGEFDSTNRSRFGLRPAKVR